MRKSEYTENQKLSILMEREQLNLSVEEICSKHKISVGTYYLWKRQFFPENKSFETDPETSKDILKTENNHLRKLYISLSEHNYELAKFLSKWNTSTLLHF